MEKEARMTDHPHPGAILQRDFMEPEKLSCLALANQIGVPANCISLIVRGKRVVTAATAVKLGRRFNVDPMFWLLAQARHDLTKELRREQ